MENETHSLLTPSLLLRQQISELLWHQTKRGIFILTMQHSLFNANDFLSVRVLALSLCTRGPIPLPTLVGRAADSFLLLAWAFSGGSTGQAVLQVIQISQKIIYWWVDGWICWEVDLRCCLAYVCSLCASKPSDMGELLNRSWTGHNARLCVVIICCIHNEEDGLYLE